MVAGRDAARHACGSTSSFPKGFFPVQDTGVLLGISEAPQTVSFRGHGRAAAGAGARDPEGSGGREPVLLHRRRRHEHDAQQRTHPDQPEAARRAQDASASEVIRRLQPAVAERHGHHAVPAARAGPDGRGPRQPHAVPVQPRGLRTRRSWPRGSPRFVERLRALPELADVASDQQNQGLRAARRRRPRHGLAAGITPQMVDDALYDAFGQRQVSTMFTQTQPVPRRPRMATRFPEAPRGPRPRLPALGAGGYGASLDTRERSRASMRRSRSTTRASSRWSRSPSTWRREASLGEAVARDRTRAPGARACRRASRPSFQGTARAFRASLANQPLLILAAIVTVYILLGVLYESYIHPITILSTLPSAGVGALLALMLCGHRVLGRRADRHHPADRHRREERDHDDRLRSRRRAQGGQGRPATRSSRRACCASGRS